MSQNETLATLRATLSEIAQIIEKTSLSGETEHSDLYIDVHEDRLDVFQAAPGEVVLTYATFREDYFTELEVAADATTQTAIDTSGDEFEFETGAEAIWNVADTLTYLDFAGDAGDTVEVELTGSSDTRLASHIRAVGPSLNTWTKLPGSEAALEDVPFWLADRFNDEEQYTNPAGDPAPTQVELKAETLDRIVDLVEEDAQAEFYPIVVEDGELRVDVGDESGSGARGTLPTRSVSGPDVENTYHDGFEEVLNVLSGQVELQTAPGNNPLAFVADREDHTIRHIVGSVSA
ncbi:hypothetical protein Z052_01930 [Halorubrum sp. C191]|uniref:hypothetical protein n=1 Tax=Halorubrum sp. C191 TaxID=1383842 RepID=UPI000C0776E4|nr:hypothetical protein [Halorubrum sp. C191]PHQ43922.1 hypothetical protein Z052_01930 [Halorubrum sp. C191]